MIKVDKVTRVNNVPVSLEVSVDNVVIKFRKHICEKKVVECGRTSDAQVYDPHNMVISTASYVKVLKMAYAILYAPPRPKKEVKQPAQLDWIRMGGDFDKYVE